MFTRSFSNIKAMNAKSQKKKSKTIKPTNVWIKNIRAFFFCFCGARDSNPGPCMHYALSLPAELSTRRHIRVLFAKKKIFINN
jgi:hypothetical protein